MAEVGIGKKHLRGIDHLPRIDATRQHRAIERRPDLVLVEHALGLHLGAGQPVDVVLRGLQRHLGGI